LGKVYPELDERLTKFIARQPVFFVATAPCLSPVGGGMADCIGDGMGGGDGHVNVSPKGYRDTFAVLGPHRVAYLDLTGSGAETIAHVRQNGKITIMFCSFDRSPKILRLYGTGQVGLPGSAQWDEVAGHFARTAVRGPGGNGSIAGANHGPHGARAIILVDVERIADSCGYAVPEMELTRERDLLDRSTDKKSPEEIAAYWEAKNSVSIDGLPALAHQSVRPSRMRSRRVTASRGSGRGPAAG
jgi:Pyridoxamine 5'-phosphate oxidase